MLSRNKIPAASRIGPFLVSSAISGKELYTGKFPDGIEAQCKQMFSTIRLLLEAAGSSPEDVVKMTVWMKDRSQRAELNKHWLEMFPDEHSRPARHTFAAPDLGGAMLIQCDILAILK